MIILKLDEVLENKGMTAYALHKASGLHQSVISKIKRNESKALTLDVLDTLCEFLDCQPSDLIVYETDVATQKAFAKKLLATQSEPATRKESATQNASDNESFLSTADAGKILGLKPRTVREYAEKGELKGKQGKQNHWSFRRSDIDTFMSSREAE